MTPILNLKNRYRDFRAALEFLTILPWGAGSDFRPHAMVPFFAAAGLVIGALVSFFDTLALLVLPRGITAVLDVALLVLISGGLHLDGLADTADGLYGNRGREKALAIMKDSRVGAMGAIALVLCLLAKWTAVANLDHGRRLWLLLAPAYARASVLFALASLPYGRRQGGTGSQFWRSPPKVYHHFGLVLTIAASALAGFQALAVNIGYLLLLVGILSFYRIRLGCITGDMLGALIEIIETGILLIACVGAIR